MADAEAPVAPQKKRNRPPKKKHKNDTSKNTGQKNSMKNSSEAASERSGPVVVGSGRWHDKADAGAVPKTAANEGSVNVTPERKNAGQNSNFQQKRKNNSTPKKGNTAKAQIQGTPQSHQMRDEGSATSAKPLYHDKVSREEKRYQMEVQRRQIEEERRKKWYNYFLNKSHDLLLLDRNKVVVLKTVEKGRPQAQFVCKVCNYYCDNMSVVGQHIRKTTHLRQLQDYNDETTLRELPDMTRDQMAVLNNYLLKVVDHKGMDPSDLETRRTISVLVSDLVTSSLPGCSVRLFGSSIHGLGLKSSDVNIDLQVPEGSLPPAMLKEVASLLRKSPHFVDIVEEFHCEFPFISFTYKKSGENCSISLNNERAVSLSILLSKYTPLDPRLAQLATLFRLWGQVTETDKAQEGTWPGYAFYLLTIFYLQQCRDPVLPVLNDMLTNKGESESNTTAKVLSMDVSEIKQKWRSNNKLSLASLWLGLLRFYTVEFNYTEYIVCIDSSALIPRKTRKLFIVDPFLPTRNVARSISSNAMFYYIIGCLMTSCRYFSTPQAKFGPLFGQIYVPAAKYHPDHEALLYAHDRINSLLVQLIMKLDTAFLQPRGDIQQSVAEVMHLMHTHDYQNVDNIPVSYLDRNCVPPRHSFRQMFVSPKDAQLLVTSFSARMIEYNFTADNCTGGQRVPKICGVCKQEGHLKDDCPEEKLPPLDPLPERSPEAMCNLDNLCTHIFEKWKQSEEDIQMRENICQELQEFIGAVHPTAKLELFGSTKNGFGLKGSDMDICLTFEDNKTGEGLDTRAFIEVLYKVLRAFKELQDLLPIATAKVPIVKFTHKATKLDGDISLYNVLALENSKLLYTYAQIDIRARILGYMMKRFSKVCRIGDASKGSLSSYAYTLLVIYFLQRCDPPVLPVLQELTEDGGPAPKHIVEGCNAYFFSDLSRLDTVWTGRGKNELSAGELWLNLLIFYTEQFDLLNNVICIRCSRNVTKFEKLWISKGIAIEDPFDLSHNLGSALTRKMSLYIIKALRKGRNHFARPLNRKVTSLKDIETYYMNVKELTDGEPPNDRGCRFCKSIGHKERDCPEKKKKGRGKSKKKEDTSMKDPPVRKMPPKSFSEDDEEDEPDDYSDSEKGSSDQEDEMHPRNVRRQLEKEAPKKSEITVVRKQNNPEGTGNNSPVDQVSKPISSKKIEWRSMGPQTLPPGFIIIDQHRVAGTPVGSVSAPSKTQNSSPRVIKQQHSTKNTNISPTVISTTTNMVFVPQNSNSPSNQTPIPTIVFSNSKLTADSGPIPLTPVRFPYPPGQETTRPPPGFIPLVQNTRFPNSPFSPEQKPQGQKCWNFEGMPFIAAPSMTNPNVELFGNVPMHTSSPLNTPITLSGGTPRPPVGPAFNSLRFTGMLGPTEQLIWGQSPSPATQPPPFQANVTEVFDAKTPPINTLDASLGKMQINSPSNSDVSTLMNVAREQLIQSDLSKKESNLNPPQNKSGQHAFAANKTILNNSS